MKFFNKVRNTGTILSIASLLIIILSTDGFNINANKIMIIIKSLCSIGVILGVLNNPETKGIDIPLKKNKLKR